MDIQILPEGPLALSLSGGGSKGAYTVGILQYLIEVKKRKEFKIIHGTSTGALVGAMVGAMVVTGDPSYFYELVKIYSQVQTGDVLDPNYELAYRAAGGGSTGELVVLGLTIANGGLSIYNSDPLLDLIDRFLTPDVWEKIINAGKENTSDLAHPIEIGFCATNLQTGESEIITNRSHPDRDILRKALLASANQPVFMPPIQIDPNSTDQFVDGGLIDYNPIEKVLESDLIKEASAIVSISLDTPGAASNPYIHQKVDTIFLRTLDILSTNIQNEDLTTAQLWNILLKLKEQLTDTQWDIFKDNLHASSRNFIDKHLNNKNYIPIIQIYPEEAIKMDSLKFQQPDMKNLIKRGFKEAIKHLG